VTLTLVWDSEPRMIALARASSICKQTRILLSDKTLHIVNPKVW
jgi:hypothetical protein